MKFGGPICRYCGRDTGFYAEVREYREAKTGERLLGWYVCCTRCNADNYVSVEMAEIHRKGLEAQAASSNG